MEGKEYTPINGLVDSKIASKILNIPQSTFKVWATRSKQGAAGIPQQMPQPVGTLNGAVYRLEDIEKFKKELAMSSRSPRTKQRQTGSYYTPDQATTLMSKWILRYSPQIILEPSAGDGAFISSIKSCLSTSNAYYPKIFTCELDAEVASDLITRGLADPALMHIGDYLQEFSIPKIDAIIGNPPYVRIRELKHPQDAQALTTAEKTMMQPMDKSGSVWVPFVAKSTHILENGGNMAMVLPLDFTYVKYARPLWAYLAENFQKITIVRTKKRIFPKIMQNVLLLFAEDKGGKTESIGVVARDSITEINVKDIETPDSHTSVEGIVSGERSFQLGLLSQETRETLEYLTPYTQPAGERIKFNIGYVSGNKTFFHPSEEQQREYSLPNSSLRKTILNSKELSQTGLWTSRLESPSNLWIPNPDDLSDGELAYIEQGVEARVDMGYKCRIRKPWYIVPGIKTPDLMLTTFSDSPRLVINDGQLLGTNSILIGSILDKSTPLDIINAWYTPFTQLSNELEIHSLGGGVLIAVPKEADAIKILKKKQTSSLNHTQLDEALRKRDMNLAYASGATVIRELIGDNGLQAIYQGIDTLSSWRKAITAK